MAAIDEPPHNPMTHPDEQDAGVEGSPHFGRLLIVLALAVALVTGITFASVAWFAH